jgi:hypothetical protein
MGFVAPAAAQHVEATPKSVVQTVAQGQEVQPTAGRKPWQTPPTHTRSVPHT